jgi:hypothetical protein
VVPIGAGVSLAAGVILLVVVELLVLRRLLLRLLALVVIIVVRFLHVLRLVPEEVLDHLVPCLLLHVALPVAASAC